MTTLYTINNLSDDINADLLNRANYIFCKELQGDDTTVRTVDEQVALTTDFYTKYKAINPSVMIGIAFPTSWINNLDNMLEYVQRITPLVNAYLVVFNNIQDINTLDKLQLIFNKTLFLI